MAIKIARRKFIAALGGVVVAWPLTAGAQQAGAVRRVGVLMNNKPTDRVYQSYYTELTQTLQKLGWGDARTFASTFDGAVETRSSSITTPVNWSRWRPI
jgi:putative ABC transport system substrate-binding protein